MPVLPSRSSHRPPTGWLATSLTSWFCRLTWPTFIFRGLSIVSCMELGAVRDCICLQHAQACLCFPCAYTPRGLMEGDWVSRSSAVDRAVSDSQCDARRLPPWAL